MGGNVCKRGGDPKPCTVFGVLNHTGMLLGQPALSCTHAPHRTGAEILCALAPEETLNHSLAESGGIYRCANSPVAPCPMAWDGHRGECRDFMLQTSPLHPQLTVRTCTQRGTLALWVTKTLWGCDAPPGLAFPCHWKALSCHPTICRGRVTSLQQHPRAQHQRDLGLRVPTVSPPIRGTTPVPVAVPPIAQHPPEAGWEVSVNQLPTIKLLAKALSCSFSKELGLYKIKQHES